MKQYTELDPDHLNAEGKNCQSVVYTDRLYLDPDKSGRTHVSFFRRGMSKTAEALRDDLSSKLNLQPDGRTTGTPDNWFELYSTYLFGRLGDYDGKRIISFWGRGANLYKDDAVGPTQLIPDCIAALFNKGVIGRDTVVVYGDGRVCLVGDILNGGAPDGSKIDREIMAKNELAKVTHMATGSDKSALMKYRKLKPADLKQHPINNSLRKAGLQNPGGAYWKMSSESKDKELNSVLDYLQDKLC